MSFVSVERKFYKENLRNFESGGLMRTVLVTSGAGYIGSHTAKGVAVSLVHGTTLKAERRLTMAAEMTWFPYADVWP